MMKPALKERSRDETAKEVARICNVSADYVRKVINGDRNNDEVLATYIEYKQGKQKLIKEVEMCIPQQGVRIRRIKSKK